MYMHTIKYIHTNIMYICSIIVNNIIMTHTHVLYTTKQAAGHAVNTDNWFTHHEQKKNSRSSLYTYFMILYFM